jgi:hypothetical protein
MDVYAAKSHRLFESIGKDWDVKKVDKENLFLNVNTYKLLLDQCVGVVDITVRQLVRKILGTTFDKNCILEVDITKIEILVG